MNDFLRITIGCCTFVIIYAIMTIAFPENHALNWITAFVLGLFISIGFLTSENNKKS